MLTHKNYLKRNVYAINFSRHVIIYTHTFSDAAASRIRQGGSSSLRARGGHSEVQDVRIPDVERHVGGNNSGKEGVTTMLRTVRGSPGDSSHVAKCPADKCDRFRHHQNVEHSHRLGVQHMLQR